MKVLSIVGARPQFIKAAVVSRQMRRVGFDELLVHTGQHYDFGMSEVFFRELELPAPSHYLGIGSGRHGEQTARMLTGIEEVLLKEDPDIVVIYGDTNTTLAGALAPVKLHIPIAHVEAGLRSFNRRMPEEINRIVADHCSDLLFCPTETAVENLKKEGFHNLIGAADIDANRPSSIIHHQFQAPLVVNVGDVMLDLARQVKERLGGEGRGQTEILSRYGLQPHEYVLTTIHRASNTDEPENLRGILEAMRQIARRGLKVLFPVHPRTRKAMEKADLPALADTAGIILSEPVSYVAMIALESEARLLLTDSGGVQKEAYFFGVPCVVAREETEWTELVEIGWNRLVGAKTEAILEATEAILREDFTQKPRPDYYGAGHAAARIVNVLQWFVGR
ncbi:MAG: UDP-N-acetylglucosamine 2-epimerase (non-hydrolyzing) [Planctomycetes bacterium]|nr:UDP-N-acetylglucosamine 2-epimerase (non-hydrolyzing) [Planctomycetota bacterium]